MGLFGFGEEKKAAKKEPVWVAPTTGNVYEEGDWLPGVSSGTFDVGKYGDGDDWIDRFMPEHSKQMAEMRDMMKTIIAQNTKLQEKVNSLEEELHQR